MSGLAELRNDLRNEVRYGLRYLVRDSAVGDRKSTRLNSSHSQISYAVFCLKKKKLIPELVDVLRIYVQVRRRRPRGGRRLRVASRELIGHHDHRVADLNHRIHQGAVLHRLSGHFLRAERLLVELDRLRRSTDHQVRCDRVHAARNRVHAGRRRSPSRGCLLAPRRALRLSGHEDSPPQYRCGQDKTDAPMPRAFHSPSQRPMKTSSSYASRMRTRRRRIPSSSKPRDSYRRRARVFDANTHSSAFLKPRTRIHSRMRFIRNLPRPTSRHPSRIAMPTPPTCCVFGKFPPSQSAEPTISPAASATNRTL